MHTLMRVAMTGSDSRDLRHRSKHDDVPLPVVEMLVAQVQRMVEESGNPEEFDARSWLENWLHTPVPALGKRLPIEYLHDPDGTDLVSRILASSQSGAYW